MDSGSLGDQATDGDERGVAGRVAVLEVEVAKTVDVEQGHRQRALVPVRAGHVQLELGPEGAEAEEAGDQRIPLGESGQLLLELANALPSSLKLIPQTLPVPHTHLTLNIGSLEAVLENSASRSRRPERPWFEL